MKMNTKKLVLNAILLGIGLVLHQIEPAIFGVKPDMTLIMLFSVMILNKDSYKNVEKTSDEANDDDIQDLIFWDMINKK